MQKEYIEPVFQFIKTDEENKVFFGASSFGTGLTGQSQVSGGGWQ